MALRLRYFSHPDMLRQFEPAISVQYNGPQNSDHPIS